MLFDLSDETAVDVVKRYLTHMRNEGRIIGLTSGSFDLIHAQHFFYFIRCRRHCDVLIVGVDSDELVRERKGPTRPLIYDFKRALMVDALKPVTFTFVMQDVPTFGCAAKLFRPDVIFKNNEFAGRTGDIEGKAYAGRVIIITDVMEHASTTDIVENIVKVTRDLDGGEGVAAALKEFMATK